MSESDLLVRLSQAETRLSDERRREFQRELICTIGFGGLDPIKRVFV